MGEDRPQERDTEASLELPGLGLRRRRRRRDRADQTGPTPEAQPDEPAADTDVAAEPVLGTTPEDTTPDDTTPDGPATGPAVDDEAVPEETVEVPPAPAPASRAPEAPARRATGPAPAGPHGYDDYDDEAPGRPQSAATATDRSRRRSALPALGGGAAALVTGLVVGLLGVLLTLLALGGCEAVAGTSSCGGAGFFLLMAILVLMVVLGRSLLDAWGVGDPGSTSFLAVGLVAVVALLFLVEVLLSWAMVVVVPVVSAGTFALSWKIATTVTDQAD